MNKNHHAVALGKRGGKAVSQRKAEAAKRNGKKGGRPRTLTLEAEAPSRPDTEWCACRDELNMKYGIKCAAHYVGTPFTLNELREFLFSIVELDGRNDQIWLAHRAKCGLQTLACLNILD